MAESNGDKQPIIVKKIKKAGHAHHGGAWKVAYADFVTAMMAFFLLLWLLNSVTEEQLQGISDYFAPVVISRSESGAGGMLAGQTLSEDGARISDKSPVITLDLPSVRAGGGPMAPELAGDIPPETPSNRELEADEEQLREALRKREQDAFDRAREALQAAIEAVPALQKLGKSLLIDNTQEGLRIQIVDQEGLAMFPRGAADMYLHTRRLVETVAKVIDRMPQTLAITGHTDATPFIDDSGYTNWELSVDRANAARRELVRLGVPEERISRVVGKADREPLVDDDPTSPRNRRLSIVLLRGTGRPGESGVAVPLESRP